jgi:hypothetical protein
MQKSQSLSTTREITMIRFLFTTVLAGFLTLSVSCANGVGVAGNEGGSEPVNDKEAVEYKKAIVRCYKIGGTKVVKIMGELRCY